MSYENIRVEHLLRGNEVQRETKQRSETLVEHIHKSDMVKPQCCFTLTLGGAGRGKTSVVRHLRRADFVKGRKETDCMTSIALWCFWGSGRLIVWF